MSDPKVTVLESSNCFDRSKTAPSQLTFARGRAIPRICLHALDLTCLAPIKHKPWGDALHLICFRGKCTDFQSGAIHERHTTPRRAVSDIPA